MLIAALNLTVPTFATDRHDHAPGRASAQAGKAESVGHPVSDAVPPHPGALSPALILFLAGLAGLGFLTRGRKRREASTAFRSTAEL